MKSLSMIAILALFLIVVAVMGTHSTENIQSDIRNRSDVGAGTLQQQSQLQNQEDRSDNRDLDLQKARETILHFFSYLYDRQYDKAVSLFEPWETGVGMHSSSWEGLASFTSPEHRSNKAQILQHYCEAVATCQKVNILNVVKVAGNEYKFKVQFIKDDGNVYEHTLCCGTTEENMPRQTEFDYYVHKIDGVFKVRTPPLFRP